VLSVELVELELVVNVEELEDDVELWVELVVLIVELELVVVLSVELELLVVD